MTCKLQNQGNQHSSSELIKAKVLKRKASQSVRLQRVWATA